MKVTNTAARLKQIMKLLNIKQVDILNAAQPHCKKLNLKLNKSDLSQYISGKVEPGQDKLTLLSLALGVSVVWLMGHDVPMYESEPDQKNSFFNDDVKFALFRGDEEITDEMKAEYESYAAFVINRERAKENSPLSKESGLSTKQRELISLFDSAPPELQAAALAVLKSAEARPQAQDGDKSD